MATRRFFGIFTPKLGEDSLAKKTTNCRYLLGGETLRRNKNFRRNYRGYKLCQIKMSKDSLEIDFVKETQLETEKGKNSLKGNVLLLFFPYVVDITFGWTS